MNAGEHETPAPKKMLKFWMKFMRLTRGRVAVLRALDVICREETDPARKIIVVSLKQTVEKGSPLSAAAAEHPDHFPLSIVELLKTAEKTGAWEVVLPEIVDGLADDTFN